MSTLWITEYTNLALNGQAPIPQEPALAEQTVTYTTTTQSALFNPRTTFVRIVPSADCHVKFGTDPTATTSHQRLTAETEYWRGVKEGGTLKVAAVDAA